MKMRRFLSGIVIFLFFFLPNYIQAQEECETSQYHFQGYTSTIASVIDNGNDTHTITLRVDYDGTCIWFEMDRYAIEADPGTYSDISVEILSGNIDFDFIDNGPFIFGEFFKGFRVKGITGLGYDEAGSFAVTYTLTGGLQDQYVRAKVPYTVQYRKFLLEDFEEVMVCQEVVLPPVEIFPYYPPLEEGKSFDIIGSELTSLNSTFVESGTYITDDIFQIINGNVIISIQTQEGQYENALSLLAEPAYGLSQALGRPQNNLITGLYPIANLLLLNELPDVLVSVSPVYSALANAGLIDSQGDKSMRSDISKDVFSVNGTGVKVGVLSDSYNTALGNLAGDDVLKGDLPGADNPDFSTPVDLLLDFPFGVQSDEGRAMMQIVHDVAPGAELAFRTGFLGPVDFANGIIELEQAGCSVIVDDVTYISAPMFRDGVVAQAVDEVTAAGVSYFSSAGNFGTKSWQGTFNGELAPEGIEGEAHNFVTDESGVDLFQNITLYQGDYTVVLQWDDGTPGFNTNSDFDIYLSYDNGSTLFGFNRVNTGGAPIEVLPFTVAAETAESNFLIVRESGSGPVELKYIVYRGRVDVNEYASPEASTIAGHANAEGAMAVGAVLFSNTPEFSGSAPTIASFSSRGGTLVNNEDRLKPEFCAPNGVNTSVNLGGTDIDGDPFPNFFGTSASAPHAAGVAALLIEARQKYYDDILTPDLVKGVLQNTAFDMGTPGYDPASGAGFILADSALLSLANPKPSLSALSYDIALTPGIDEIWVTVEGEYINAESSIWFNGAPLDGASVVAGNTSISALIPPYEEPNPKIQVFNNPKAGTNGLDGGLSNPLYFIAQQTILVEVDDQTKKYGQSLPSFTATYSLETPDGFVPLETSGLPQYDIDRIYAIALITVADNFSNVGLWGIEPNGNDPLSPDSDVEATEPFDISMLERYDIVFNNGLLSVDPLDLKITPRDTTFVYNDSIDGFSFDYDISGVIDLIESDSLAIVSAAQSSHLAALLNPSALIRGTALVNDLGEELIDEEVLLNISIMVTELAYQTRGTALVNGEAIDAIDFYDAAIANANVPGSPLSFARLVRGTALVNGYSLVRGTALVNDLDTAGNIVNTTPLVNAETIVNSSGIMNSSSINLNSNVATLVIMTEGDIAIFSGDSTGNVVMRSINLITGETVGSHLSVPGAFVTNNFNLTYGVGNYTVTPAEVEIMINSEDLSAVYDGQPKSIPATTEPEDVELAFTYDGEVTPPINAGSYEVGISSADANYMGSATATFVINPKAAVASAGDYYISQVEDLPVFEAEYEGLVEGDENSELLSVEFEVSPEFSGETGIYDIIPLATSINYVFTADNGVLYVNPGGEGAQPVQPNFFCLEELYEPDANGFLYLGHFYYENENDVNVYIPKGSRNTFLGADRDESDQPIVFTPGTSFFDIPFDGGVLKWIVKSDNSNGLETNNAAASEASCAPQIVGNTPELFDVENEKHVLAYPNPSTGNVFLQLEGVNPETAVVEVYDFLGRKCEVSAIQSSENQLHLDLSKFSKGIYVIRISDQGWMERVNVYVE